MKPARIIVLIIAIVAGGFAALLAGRSEKPAEPVRTAAPIDTVNVLVARRDIPMGQTLTAEDMRWQVWPREAASASFVRRSDKPQAIESFGGAIARSPFVAGEPIREDKIIKAGGSGFMAAILPSGKRALSTEISPETGAGGFILPNDRVDVILTRRERSAESRGGGEKVVSEIILSDIRVLAIDQTVQEKDGQRVVVGRTATLEVTPGQAETLALSRQQGTLSLALRSLADANSANDADSLEEARRRNRREINMVRYGVATTAAQR
jgi:pilus assembly protein CpaB